MKKTAKSSAPVVVDITCDGCGNSVVPSIQKSYQDNLDGFKEFGVLHAQFGYGSNQDGNRYHFDLCETCFEKLLSTVERLRANNGLNS